MHFESVLATISIFFFSTANDHDNCSDLQDQSSSAKLKTIRLVEHPLLTRSTTYLDYRFVFRGSLKKLFSNRIIL